MRVKGVARFERFFRVAAGLDVDKEDLKRLDDFVGRKINDLLLRGEAMAKANGRDIIEPFDLPITKGLQENIHQFRAIDRDLELEPILDDITPSATARPGLQRRDGGAARRPRRRPRPCAGPQLQDHRPGAEEPGHRALGAGASGSSTC